MLLPKAELPSNIAPSVLGGRSRSWRQLVFQLSIQPEADAQFWALDLEPVVVGWWLIQTLFEPRCARDLFGSTLWKPCYQQSLFYDCQVPSPRKEREEMKLECTIHPSLNCKWEVVLFSTECNRKAEVPF